MKKLIRKFKMGILVYLGRFFLAYNKNREVPTRINIWLEKIDHFTRFGKFPDFKKPKSMNQYFCHQKLYGDLDKLAEISDKYRVREKIKTEIGEKYLLKIFDVVEDLDLITKDIYENYPEQFVAKPTHVSGRLFINMEKNYQLFKAKTAGFLREFGNVMNELHYKRIKPRLLIEELMQPKNGRLVDYKFWVINGRVEYVHVAENLLIHKFSKDADNRRMYTRNWETAEFQRENFLAKPIEKPENLKEMIEIAEKLSIGWHYMRVDLYNYDDQIKFGEMTPSPGGGRKEFIPHEYDKLLFDKYLR